MSVLILILEKYPHIVNLQNERGFFFFFLLPFLFTSSKSPFSFSPPSLFPPFPPLIGETPVHIACVFHSKESVVLLTKFKNADFSVLTNKGFLFLQIYNVFTNDYYYSKYISYFKYIIKTQTIQFSLPSFPPLPPPSPHPTQALTSSYALS